MSEGRMATILPRNVYTLSLRKLCPAMYTHWSPVAKRIHAGARTMQTADLVRAKTFNIRFSEEESERLDAVAEHYALTAAGVIRMLVKREADRIGMGSKTTSADGGVTDAEPADRAPSRPRMKSASKVRAKKR